MKTSDAAIERQVVHLQFVDIVEPGKDLSLTRRESGQEQLRLWVVVLDLYFNDGFMDTTAPCPHITWAGTITFEDEGTYGMAFIPTGEKESGKAFHFWEDWEIYDEPFVFTGGILDVCVPVDSDVVMAGYDKGVSSPNGKYRMNGPVTDTAPPFGPFDGRQVHMGGVIFFDTAVGALTAPGTFRVN